MQHERRYETAEHVLPGHPDKLCDAAVDGIVDALRQLDPKAQCGLEMACVFNEVVLTGRIAACEEAITKFQEQGGCKPLIRKAYQNAGYGTDEGKWNLTNSPRPVTPHGHAWCSPVLRVA